MGKSTVNIFKSRLAQLRANAHLSQRELAAALSEVMGTDSSESISSITISAYERGNRMPIVNTLIAIATYFNVSLDYLTGLDERSEIKKVNDTPQKDLPFVEPDILIGVREYKKYHNNPVYVMTPNEKNLRNRWGILDYEKRRIVFTDLILPLTPDLKLFQYKPIEAQYLDVSFKQPLTIAPLCEATKPVWCEMLNGDSYIKGLYNGWYRHNENHTALINENNGLVLPYGGCGISYNAYSL